MKYQLTSDWPCGQWLVPTGTIIDGNNPQWNGTKLPLAMPLTCIALDVEAANALVEWHSHSQHLLHFAPGIKPTVRINV
ncbi:hypothetical protein [Bradyrhizobium ganzhouense]|uniref:hypothetical protein n=1 Tax=Bradyrhizobium ganzhouense TaxID=1179767 RepID=UPI003CEA658E